MSEGPLVGTPKHTRQRLVCPTDASRPPRGLPIAGLTILQACDVRREITRGQGGMLLQTP